MYNKRGQSLVEVVVACTILIVVLSGVVTLIVNVMNLTVMSRNSLTATSIAQKKLYEKVTGYSNSCNAGINPQIYGSPDLIPWDPGNFSTAVGFVELTSAEKTNFSDDRYLKLVSRVSYTNKGYGVNVIEVAEIVRKN